MEKCAVCIFSNCVAWKTNSTAISSTVQRCQKSKITTKFENNTSVNDECTYVALSVSRYFSSLSASLYSIQYISKKPLVDSPVDMASLSVWYG